MQNLKHNKRSNYEPIHMLLLFKKYQHDELIGGGPMGWDQSELRTSSCMCDRLYAT